MKIYARPAAVLAFVFSFSFAPSAWALAGPTATPPGLGALSTTSNCNDSAPCDLYGGTSFFSYPTIDTAATRSLYWVMPTPGANIGLSYSATASNLAAGTAVFTSASTFSFGTFNGFSCNTVVYNIQAVVNVTDLSGHALALQEGSAIDNTLPTQPTLVVPGPFRFNVQVQAQPQGSASWSAETIIGGNWVCPAETTPDVFASVTVGSNFYYDATPAIGAVTPNYGTAGDSVTITNTCCLAGSSVTIGGVAAAVGTTSDTSVSLTVPQTPAGGAADVAVTTSYGTTTDPGGFTYRLPPSDSESFGALSILIGQTTTLSFTLTNPAGNTDALTGVGVTDTLPSGLQVANLSSTNTCGGTVSLSTSTITLSGGSIPAGTNCTFSVNVSGTTPGNLNDTSTATAANAVGLQSNGAASIAVLANPPTTQETFSPTTIAVGATSTLTFTITNPGSNPVQLTGVGFTDTLPTGLSVSNLTATACGGTLTLTSPTSISLSGASIGVSSQCQFNVTVSGDTAGNYTNTTSAVTSSNASTGAAASANLVVTTAPVISNINPTQGSTAGGEAVTITGFNLTGASVTFGGAAATVNTSASTSLGVTTPPHAAGAVDVVVTTGNGSATSTGGFTYITCSYSLGSSAVSAPAGGMSGSFNVTTSSGCPWTALSDSAWLTTSSTGNGNGSVSYAVAASTSTVVRVGTITVGGQTFTVTQSGVTVSNLVATGSATPSVSLTWSASSSVDHFEVWKNSGSGFVRIATPSSASYTDPAVAGNTAYTYKVCAVDSGANKSAFSNIDVATTMNFTDDALVAKSTVIKATHILELRQAVNAARTLAGLSAYSYTDSSLTGVKVRLVHITDLRTALDQARSALQMAPLTYTNIAVGSPVSALDVMQLRDGVR